jgi:hypothetical protein
VKKETTLTRTYWQTVGDIADEAIDEYPAEALSARLRGHFYRDNDDDSCASQEYVQESVDGSEYIIYYHRNDEVLANTKNEPDAADVRAMSDDDADWRKMRMTSAYLAMEADVMQEMHRKLGLCWCAS